MKKLLATALGSLFLTCNGAQADQVIADDLIVQGSLCTGFDCVINESFGFDTIRLKENNTRIKFEDTSTSSGFPTTDWQLTANDSASGGASKFSIEDVTNALIPFTVTAAAPTNSIFVASTGKVGFRTSTPGLDLHMTTSDTPAIRFEQTSAGGFTAQTWDIGANEANFFVRDLTGGSRLPFRIRPGAPTSSIDIGASGKVGMGTASPGTPLHVKDSTAIAGGRDIIQLENYGPTRLLFTNNQSTIPWVLNNSGSTVDSSAFVISDVGDAKQEFKLDPAGNLTILGSLTQNSDVNNKENIYSIDGKAILDKLATLPIKTWKYKQDDSKIRHLGPMAQDFYASFGLGGTETGISVTDSTGVALVGIQELNKNLKEKDKTIQVLEARIAHLEMLVEKLASHTVSSKVLALTDNN